MKRDKNMLIAFFLNFSFSFFEFIGGIVTGSSAIMSDSVHDIGDAASIGLSLLLEKQSRREPDGKYTYGYLRFSVLGGLITTVVLLTGSIMVIINAINKIMNPSRINYDGMIVFALIGLAVNSVAAFITHKGASVNERAVSLHMLEDVSGWAIVLIGAFIIKFTDFVLIDPIMSIGVSLFILYNAGKNLKEIADLFLLKAPEGISVDEVAEKLCGIEGVYNAHHIHLWSIDTRSTFASMHLVIEGDGHKIKDKVRSLLKEHGIVHCVLETEGRDEHCHERVCTVSGSSDGHSHHHHHHHH